MRPVQPTSPEARAAAGICDTPVVSKVCDAAEQAVAAPFEWLAYAMAETAAWLYERVWAIYDSTTVVDVTNSGYLAVYNLMFGIGVVLALLMFCLQLLTGLVRRDPAALTRAAFGLARAILGSFLVITLTAAALEIVDQLCVGIVHATGNTMDDMGGRITAMIIGITAINVGSPTVGTVLTMFLAALAISAAVMVWFSLLMRKALLLVAIVLAPIVLSGQGWDAARGWFAKWATFVLALLCSKLVLTVIFLVATTQASAPIDFDLTSLSEPVTGIVLMFIAAFAPYMTYKFLSFAGVDTYHAITTEQEAKSSLNRPIPVPSTPRAHGVPGVLHSASGAQGSGGSVGATVGSGDPTANNSGRQRPETAAPTPAQSTPTQPTPQNAGSPDGNVRGQTPPADSTTGSNVARGAGTISGAATSAHPAAAAAVGAAAGVRSGAHGGDKIGSAGPEHPPPASTPPPAPVGPQPDPMAVLGESPDAADERNP